MEKAINAAIEAAAGKQIPAPVETVKAEPAPTPTTEPAVAQDNKGQAAPTAPAEKQNDEWDGDVNKLPPELQTWAKKAQSHLTKKAMAESELRKKGQEYLDFQQSEDWKQFQEYKSKPNPTAQPAGKEAPSTDGVTPDEWEAAMLDSTGQVASRLLRREAERVVAQREAQYSQKLQSLEYRNQQADYKRALSEFADEHPDVIEMHSDGYFMSILESEMSSGKHKSYESAINKAYETAAQIKARADARALAASQGRVTEKKSAVVSTGTSTGNLSSIEVPKGEVFEKAFEAALQNKKVNVRAKR